MAKTLKPSLRFKGFTDTWEQRKVKDIFNVTRGYVLAATKTIGDKTIDAQYPVYSSQTKKMGLMGYYNDFLYENAITWTTDGANAGTVNYRAGKFYCTNVCGVLLSNEIEANQMMSEALNNIAKHHVSYVGNPKLMNNVMSAIEISIPSSYDERSKISRFLEKIDKLVTLHQRKYDKLVNVKKALLEKMFPKNGELVPRLRFNGFTDTWEQRKLDDMSSNITKQTGFDYSATIKPSLLNENNGRVYSFIQNKDFDGEKINLNTDFYIPVKIAERFPKILLDRPSLLITISGKIGNVGYYKLKRKAFIGGAVGICKLKRGNGSIIVYSLQSDSGQKYFQSLVKASSHSNITVEDIRKIKVFLPKSRSEEQKIVQLLSRTDNLITLHQRKYEKLVNIKKALLQKMFV